MLNFLNDSKAICNVTVYNFLQSIQTNDFKQPMSHRMKNFFFVPTLWKKNENEKSLTEACKKMKIYV